MSKKEGSCFFVFLFFLSSASLVSRLREWDGEQVAGEEEVAGG